MYHLTNGVSILSQGLWWPLQSRRCPPPGVLRPAPVQGGVIHLPGGRSPDGEVPQDQLQVHHRRHGKMLHRSVWTLPVMWPFVANLLWSRNKWREIGSDCIDIKTIYKIILHSHQPRVLNTLGVSKSLAVETRRNANNIPYSSSLFFSCFVVCCWLLWTITTRFFFWDSVVFILPQ